MSSTDKHFCRFCGTELKHTFVDLGDTPLANSYLSGQQLAQPEPSYPLHARVCSECLLVQVAAVVSPEDIFSDYAYFSSYSSTWMEHARRFARASIERFSLDRASLVVEVASNDGYLLRHYAAEGIPVLGVEPAANVAEAAREVGVPTEVRFFGEELAHELRQRGDAADLLIGNNVFAHVPELNDFAAGLAAILKDEGAVSLEFPHLLRLIEQVQFDTIYHEHFCYFSLWSAQRVLAHHGLRIFDVEHLPTHGGSLRVFADHADVASHELTPAVEALRVLEHEAGLDRLQAYEGFGDRVSRVKTMLLDFLHAARAQGETVVAYGAAAKGNTLLNTCGIDTGLIAYVADQSPHKQGRYLPGSRLPIYPPERIRESRPDYVLILPWNLEREITDSLDWIRAWGGRFVIPIPELRIVP